MLRTALPAEPGGFSLQVGLDVGKDYMTTDLGLPLSERLLKREVALGPGSQ